MRLSLPLLFSFFAAAPALAGPVTGHVRLRTTPYGSYYEYMPGSFHMDSRILVIVHGEVPPGGTAEREAYKYITRWTSAAERERVLLLAPAFNRKDYAAGAGYAGLFGRKTNADQFLLEILDRYRGKARKHADNFMLYGHGTGGAFVIRFAVMNSDYLQKAVASAPSGYAFPDPELPWPDGMARFSGTIRWEDPGFSRDYDFAPDPKKWFEAAKADLAVVVGKKDAKAEIRRAKDWVRRMREYAEETGIYARTRLELVHGADDNPRKLTPACRELIFPVSSRWRGR